MIVLLSTYAFAATALALLGALLGTGGTVAPRERLRGWLIVSFAMIVGASAFTLAGLALASQISGDPFARVGEVLITIASGTALGIAAGVAAGLGHWLPRSGARRSIAAVLLPATLAPLLAAGLLVFPSIVAGRADLLRTWPVHLSLGVLGISAFSVGLASFLASPRFEPARVRGALMRPRLWRGVALLVLVSAAVAVAMAAGPPALRIARTRYDGLRAGSPPPPRCDDLRCDARCEFGFAKDGAGCPTCTCAPNPACSDAMCKMWCEFGFKTDERGCPICACRTRPVVDGG